MTTPRRFLTLTSNSTSTALVGAALTTLHALAAAQVAPQALTDCAAIIADSERLACFDRVSGRSAPPASDPKNMPQTPAPGSLAAATAAAAAAPAPARNLSMFDKAWAFDPSSPRYDVSLYAPNYLLFGRYTDSVNNAPYDPLVNAGVVEPGTTLDATEAAFQLSLKFRLWTTDDRRWGAWAAYTQQSHWQVFNDSGNASRPFRETNYMPELILAYKPDVKWGDWQLNLATFAFNHQSNGRSDLLSRSWNRLIAGAGVENGNFALLGRLWWRLPESDDTDNNPTINDYYGYGDLSAIYKWRGQSFSGMIRGNAGTGKGAVQATWTSAPLLGPLRGYVKVFSGYGETMIDYKWNQSTIGIGVTLNDWL